MLGAGLEGYESSGYRVEKAHRVEFEHIRSDIRGQMDEAPFAEGLAEGRSLTLEQAITFAVAED